MGPEVEAWDLYRMSTLGYLTDGECFYCRSPAAGEAF